MGDDIQRRVGIRGVGRVCRIIWGGLGNGGKNRRVGPGGSREEGCVGGGLPQVCV